MIPWNRVLKCGVRGPISGISVNPIYLDVDMPANTTFVYPLAEDHATLAYVFGGQALFGSSREKVEQKDRSQLVAFSEGRLVKVETTSTPVRFLLLAGSPIHEQIARRGPFVMNTQDEIEKAFRDFRNGTFLETQNTETNIAQ